MDRCITALTRLDVFELAKNAGELDPEYMFFSPSRKLIIVTVVEK